MVSRNPVNSNTTKAACQDLTVVANPPSFAYPVFRCKRTLLGSAFPAELLQVGLLSFIACAAALTLSYTLKKKTSAAIGHQISVD